MSIADRPGLAVGFAGGVLAMNGTNFAGIAAGETTGISGGFLAALLAGFVAGYVVEFLKKITEKLPASLNGIRPMLIYPLGGILIVGAVMCGINPINLAIQFRKMGKRVIILDADFGTISFSTWRSRIF